jgi:hypothetical protein
VFKGSVFAESIDQRVEVEVEVCLEEVGSGLWVEGNALEETEN